MKEEKIELEEITIKCPNMKKKVVIDFQSIIGTYEEVVLDEDGGGWDYIDLSFLCDCGNIHTCSLNSLLVVNATKK